MDAEKRPGPIWHEGHVDRDGEHLLLTYGEGSIDNDLEVALVGLDPQLRITVQFLIAATEGDDRAGHILSELRQELDTQLAGEFKLEVWDEAKYHSTVPSDPGSKVHWHYRFDWDRDPHASAKWN